MRKKLALLYGGKSAEHEVSLQTAKAVIGALDMKKFDVYPVFINKAGEWIAGPMLAAPVTDVKSLMFVESAYASPFTVAPVTEETIRFDVVFPLLHGPNGEDGTVQGLLELLNLPYVGNGVLASSAGMDKVLMKNIFAEAGIPQAKYIAFLRSEWQKDQANCFEQVADQLGYPCFVKPANLGSSVGISKCADAEQLAAAFVEAFQFDRKVIVEEGIDGREIEMGVLGNDEPTCSVVGELALKKDFYDYHAKYEDGGTEIVIPAQVSDSDYQQLVKMAIRAFKALDCAGLVRADFFLGSNGKLYINEVNTMPGFTPFSMFPQLWKASGLDYPQLIEEMITLGVQRHQEKQLIKFTF